MDPVLQNKQVVISTSYNVDNFTVYGLQDLVGDVDRATQPAVEVYSPVLNDNSGRVAYEDRKDSDLVAIIGLSIFWRDLIEGVLPEGNDGLVIVFSNECNQTFTFRVDGPTATYIGSGDLHDTDFDHLKESTMISDLSRFSAVHDIYTGAPLNEDFCPYKLELYASKDMAEECLTSAPFLFAVISVLICTYLGILQSASLTCFPEVAFTSIVFLTYDYVIEKRQKTVMKTATRSSAILSSLFPPGFRSRLEENAVPESSSTARIPQHRLPNLFAVRRNSSGPVELEEETSTEVRQMADFYQSTTVLFADIKGFTKW